MTLPDMAVSVCLLSMGILIVGTGLRRLNRLDHRRMEVNRQNACRWHHWQLSKNGSVLGCTLCGKMIQMAHPARERETERSPWDHPFP